MDKKRAFEVLELVKEAQKLGRQAGAEQLKKLQKAGNRWVVVDDVEKKEVGRMLDVCGIGMLRVAGNSEIVRAFKLLGITDKDRSDIHYGAGENKMLIYKGDRGYGMILWLTNRQEMSVHEASTDTVANFLTEHGLECTARTAID